MKTLFVVVFALLVASTQADALSIDASALSSSENRQVMISANHIQPYDVLKDGEIDQSVTLELSSKYVRSQDREAIWSAGVSANYGLSGGFAFDSDFYVYQSHSTFAGGFGIGNSIVFVSAGSRVEYDNDDQRSIFGRAVIVFKRRYKKFAFTGKAEALRNSDKVNRFDYRGALRYQMGGKIYVATTFEEIRNVKVQGISLGVQF